jgi:hypothetical protein
VSRSARRSARCSRTGRALCPALADDPHVVVGVQARDAPRRRDECVQDQILQGAAPDTLAVAARALPARRGAGEVVAADDGHCTTAAAAKDLVGQHIADAAMFPEVRPIGPGRNWRHCRRDPRKHSRKHLSLQNRCGLTRHGTRQASIRRVHPERTRLGRRTGPPRLLSVPKPSWSADKLDHRHVADVCCRHPPEHVARKTPEKVGRQHGLPINPLHLATDRMQPTRAQREVESVSFIFHILKIMLEKRFAEKRVKILQRVARCTCQRLILYQDETR